MKTTTKKTIVYLLAAQEPCTLTQIMEECIQDDKTPELAVTVLIAIAEMVKSGTICGDFQDGDYTWVLSEELGLKGAELDLAREFADELIDACQ